MRLYDGTGEYVRADEVRPDDLIRLGGEFLRVLTTEQVGPFVVLRYETGAEESVPPATRLLRKLP